MSRNIKTVKCLEKHIGKTVKVVDEKGHTFLATVKAGNKGPCLSTSNKIADDSISWWGPIDGEWGHHCVENYQITDELKSLTLVSVTTKEEKKEKQEDAWTSSVWPQDYINKVFKTSEGEYIAFLKSNSKDGAGPAVCCFTDGTRGWCMYKGEKDTVTTGVPKEFFKVFKSAFFVSTHDEYGTPEEYICSVKDTDKLQKIYEELNTEEEKKDFLTRKEIKEAVGKYCKLADGQTAFIAEARGSRNPLICFSERMDGRYGWLLGCTPDVIKRYMSTAKEFKRGWYVTDDDDAAHIKVVEILEDKTAESKKTLSDKTAESKKTVLDLTVRELLEKLNEIVER